MQRHSVTVPIMINTLQSRPCEVDERSMLECGRLMVKPARAFEIHQPYLPLQTESLRSMYTLPPPLKWAGGKRWQLPHLRKLWETSHYVDVIAEKDGRKILVSLKWQQVAGTA